MYDQIAGAGRLFAGAGSMWAFYAVKLYSPGHFFCMYWKKKYWCKVKDTRLVEVKAFRQGGAELNPDF